MQQPFMTNHDLLESLEGQQYLVLRPTGRVAAFYDDAQARLLQTIPYPVPHPNTGHVTLRGFHEPDRVGELRAVLTQWAAGQRRIRVEVQRIDGFPPPFQVVIARLQRTTSLVTAYAALTAALNYTDLRRIGELPLDEWVFHLSLIYGGTLDATEWEQLHQQTRHEVPDPPACTVLEAEFVWYQHATEHRERLPLAGT